mgnify:CR=1 FL=1
MKKKTKKPPEFLAKSRHLLNVCHRLATGPNEYKSLFGKVLEYTFRRDYFTLQTIVMLVDQVVEDPAKEIVFAGSILDLSRRVLEDMLYMEYIATKDKEKYSKQLFDFYAVERKQDLDFMKSAGVKGDPEVVAKVLEEYEATPTKLKTRHNWAGMKVEEVINWLIKQGKIEESKKKDILVMYLAGNRKNHTSSTDILHHQNQEVLDGAAGLDIEMGLMITHGALARIGLFLIEETETDEVIKKSLWECWNSINQD